jgi:hypothetical protein
MKIAANVFLLLSCLMLAGAATAQAYRWVDKDGKVRYSDVPPQGQKATTIKPPSGGPAAAAKDKEAPKPPAAKNPRDAQDAAEKEKQEAAAKENCALSREQLTLMESGQRVMKLDAKGERYFIDDTQRAQEIAKAKENVSQWCK